LLIFCFHTTSPSPAHQEQIQRSPAIRQGQDVVRKLKNKSAKKKRETNHAANLQEYRNFLNTNARKTFKKYS
jgi:hypothetical protein